MAIPVWRGSTIATPSVNPNASLAAAGQAFSNLSRNLQTTRDAESLAAYRAAQLEDADLRIGQAQTRLDYELGAEDREAARILIRYDLDLFIL